MRIYEDVIYMRISKDRIYRPPDMIEKPGGLQIKESGMRDRRRCLKWIRSSFSFWLRMRSIARGSILWWLNSRQPISGAGAVGHRVGKKQMEPPWERGRYIMKRCCMLSNRGGTDTEKIITNKQQWDANWLFSLPWNFPNKWPFQCILDTYKVPNLRLLRRLNVEK